MVSLLSVTPEEVLFSYFLIWMCFSTSLREYFIYMVSLPSAFSTKPILVFLGRSSLGASRFLVESHWLSCLILNSARVVLPSSFDYMVSLLFTSSTTPIPVVSEEVLFSYFLIWICSIYMVSPLSLSSTKPILVFPGKVLSWWFSILGFFFFCFLLDFPLNFWRLFALSIIQLFSYLNMFYLYGLSPFSLQY